MWTTTVQPVVIALMVVLKVAVWQVRVALATRGRKRMAAALGAVNAVISGRVGRGTAGPGLAGVGATPA